MGATIRQGTIEDLRELLRAIDRRLPRLLHVDEAGIASEAAALREQAVELLARLEALETGGRPEVPGKEKSAELAAGQPDHEEK